MRATVLVLALMASACNATSPTPSPVGDLDLSGTWRLTIGRGEGGAKLPIVDDYPITLIFTGSSFGGVSACNQYGGRFSLAGGALSIGEIAGTAMGCAPDVAAAESAYLAALRRMSGLRVEGAELVLDGPDVELRFTRLPDAPTTELVDTTWTLESLFVNDAANAPLGEPATLELSSDGTFSGSTGCRTFSGKWIEQGNRIVAPSMSMDQTSCESGLQAQDSHVVSVIGDGFVPTLEGDRLTLTDPGSIGLVYRAAD